MKPAKNPRQLLLPRRALLKTVGTAVALAPLVSLLGCGGSTGAGTSDSTDGTWEGASGTWATGGTASMSGNYADPFTEGLGSTCALYKASTLGPCHALTVERMDLSEGQAGLPVRLAFLVVNASCQPMPGATVELWHANPSGLYSGSDAANMCTNGNAAARAARYFRGIQTADANGRVDFNTCFPGWYSSRSVHIHFTVRVGGTEYLTSQLFFDDALNNEIIASQPLYGTRGAKDTANANDKVIKESSLSNHLFQAKQLEDGALLAWKTLVVHA
ncbi:protocatechuate 3,4-dioxygenase [Archangium sp.]|uniref:dioxygenase family protein n=1 Tax=Archangium sp. TaxID=1872627 RepID=UPI003899E6B0